MLLRAGLLSPGPTCRRPPRRPRRPHQQNAPVGSGRKMPLLHFLRMCTYIIIIQYCVCVCVYRRIVLGAAICQAVRRRAFDFYPPHHYTYLLINISPCAVRSTVHLRVTSARRLTAATRLLISALRSGGSFEVCRETLRPTGARRISRRYYHVVDQIIISKTIG